MNSKITAIVASLVILVAGVILWRTLYPETGRFDPEPAIGVGQALALETVKAIQDHGRIAVVIHASSQGQVGADPVIWTAFRTEINKHPGISLVATEVDPPDTDGLPGCSTAAFKDILQRHSQLDAIVFFMPLTPWSFFQAQGTLPSPPTPKIIVMSGPTFTPHRYYSGYFSNQLVSVLIVGRVNPAPDQIANPRTPVDKFHNEYQIFTSQNFESMP